METIGGMKFYTFEEILDRHYGPIGTPERDAFEAAVEAALEAEAEKDKQKQACADKAGRKNRRAQHLTQNRLDFAPVGKVALQ